jgi:anti-sigma B factor antagonist
MTGERRRVGETSFGDVQREVRGQLAIHAIPRSDGLRVTVAGDLDAAAADRFLDAVLNLPDEPNLSVDLAGVDFCDSSGVGTLIRLRQHQTDIGGTLRLINTREVVLRVIETTGLDSYLGVPGRTTKRQGP